MDMSRLCGLTPRPTDSAPCGSKSTSSTRRPYAARAAPRLIVLVVLPTPPFWFAIAMIRAGPCRSSGTGWGMGRRWVTAVGSGGRRSAPRLSPDCSARISEVHDSAWCWMPVISSYALLGRQGGSPPLADSPSGLAKECAVADCTPRSRPVAVDDPACCVLTWEAWKAGTWEAWKVQWTARVCSHRELARSVIVGPGTRRYRDRL